MRLVVVLRQLEFGTCSVAADASLSQAGALVPELLSKLEVAWNGG